MRRALWSRDRGCGFPACPNKTYVHAHHINHWAHGGETSLANLVLLCSTHHRLLHEGGFSVRRAANGEWMFRDARGRIVDGVPVSADVLDDGAGGLVEWAEDAGLRIDAETSLPEWDGSTLNYGEAVAAALQS